MKNIYKFLLMLVVVAAVGTSCAESETAIDELYDNVDTETGVVLRTIAEPAELLFLTNPDQNTIALTFEVQRGNGSFTPNVSEVRAYVRLFEDQDLIEPVATTEGGEISEVLVNTLTGADLEIFEDTGLPRGSFSFVTQTIIDAYPENIDLPAPSFIALRLEVEMTDGSVYSNLQVGTTISGGIYFNSPFLYKIIFIAV